jgi:hypothetical protein
MWYSYRSRLSSYRCALPWTPTEEITILFPELPVRASVFGPPEYRISWFGEEGRLVERRTGMGSGGLRVALPARSSLPVLAVPLFGGKRDLLLPAGGLYPHDVVPGGFLPLTWENGFAAGILVLAEDRGFPVNAFNAERFFREIRARGGGNPWMLDRARILETLAGLSFRADRIVKAKRHPLRIPGLGGEWVSWNTLLEPFLFGDEEYADFGYFPSGFHRFFRSGDTGSRLDVDIGEDGSTVWREFSTR